MASSTVSMKLLIDSESKRVLFAEASKETVDFLFHILSLPVATVVSLLRKQGMVGSLTNLYESVEKLNESYILPNQKKDTLLKPMPPAVGISPVHDLLLANVDATTDRIYYVCGNNVPNCYDCCYDNFQLCSYSVSDDPRAICPQCNKTMNKVFSYVAPPGEKASTEGGFVKGVVTYMIMDNLVVNPMSTISSITLINKFNVKDVGILQEKDVTLGMDEAVKLLKASLQSQKVLTDVFLNCK
ncbi:uncharacterized protein [Henckelia pumila]|uniref:uncharacterized protein n=1 Tax=Henckelia pumila TaxID=405737 RepID=UPI003C6DFD60